MWEPSNLSCDVIIVLTTNLVSSFLVKKVFSLELSWECPNLNSLVEINYSIVISAYCQEPCIKVLDTKALSKVIEFRIVNYIYEWIILDNVDSPLACGESNLIITIFFEEARKVGNVDAITLTIRPMPSYQNTSLRHIASIGRINTFPPFSFLELGFEGEKIPLLPPHFRLLNYLRLRSSR